MAQEKPIGLAGPSSSVKPKENLHKKAAAAFMAVRSMLKNKKDKK